MNGLEENSNGSIRVDVLDATAPESKTQIKSYGFRNHGMVIFDGKDQLKWKKDGHLIEEAEIRDAVQSVVISAG